MYGEWALPRIINVLINTEQNRHLRHRVCKDLSGDVLEIGFGSGLNPPHLPAGVKRLLAVVPWRRHANVDHPRAA